MLNQDEKRGCRTSSFKTLASLGAITLKNQLTWFQDLALDVPMLTLEVELLPKMCDDEVDTVHKSLIDTENLVEEDTTEGSFWKEFPERPFKTLKEGRNLPQHGNAYKGNQEAKSVVCALGFTSKHGYQS
jgi:hypothetical protein